MFKLLFFDTENRKLPIMLVIYLIGLGSSVEISGDALQGGGAIAAVAVAAAAACQAALLLHLAAVVVGVADAVVGGYGMSR